MSPLDIDIDVSIQLSQEQRKVMRQMFKPVYPRGFYTPDGRPVSIRKMAQALREIRKRGVENDFPGWEWFPVKGATIIRDFRDGLNDRINRR